MVMQHTRVDLAKDAATLVVPGAGAGAGAGYTNMLDNNDAATDVGEPVFKKRKRPAGARFRKKKR